MLDFTLQSLNITINQVSIGNKKLTKTIFNQIEFRDPFDENIDFIGDSIIGYVKDKDSRFLLWVKEGKLRKTNLNKYYLLRYDPGISKIGETEWFLNKVSIKFDLEENYHNKFLECLEQPERYKELIDKVKKFLEGLVDRQIFL
ncbi:hypothetical protein [Sphingobacterium multivorum]|uniref:Uncharacterized protein n=1 Tax=Sphingobacterium multivorum TaxID=28454 RepID=A0A653XHY4_SPHMU|nr:hypothetical protein [Sphingobacterium multivorum]QQT43486.1 hypothetical protein I6J00_17245 [Sphingobacterium multivorum]SUI98044.1 Uncharacterised protein [Sphingobacterium multivorum]VXC29659.1 conserved hypothetical protein [Sphingobacterium multivorum]HAE66501.1 hypothetical protein [Sphingobacterium sp.]